MKKILCTALCLLLVNCSDFLDKRSDTSLAIAYTLEANQALLDNYEFIGFGNISGELSAGDIIISDEDYAATSEDTERRLYTWQPDRVAKANGNDWSNIYAKINIANTVLANIELYNIGGAGNVKGQALVHRAALYLEAVSLWAPAYDANTASVDWGVPLRLSPDMSEVSVRASVEEVYHQIIQDLTEAIPLLPLQQVAASRQSRLSALGYLARAYLYMGDYEKALNYAAEALDKSPQLMDYNSLDPSSSYPFTMFNQEVLFHLASTSTFCLSKSVVRIQRELYDSYEENDLRKSIFFVVEQDGRISFKGNYSGDSLMAMPMAVDEIYLIAAECYAETNQVAKAMQTLNALLVTRYKRGTFNEYTASSKEAALSLIREERRKELVFRNLRWSDLKRYNRDGAGISLRRVVQGKEYVLPPNDPRYAIAIPEDVIELSGMPQNPR